jgi:hypothetical protein
MEDTRDKRPVYMSTFQKRTDKLKAEIKSELDELDIKIASIDKKLSWFFGILLISMGILVASNFIF